MHSLAKKENTESGNAQKVKSDSSSAVGVVWLRSPLHNSLLRFGLSQAAQYFKLEFLWLWS